MLCVCVCSCTHTCEFQCKCIVVTVFCVFCVYMSEYSLSVCFTEYKLASLVSLWLAAIARWAEHWQHGNVEFENCCIISNMFLHLTSLYLHKRGHSSTGRNDSETQEDVANIWQHICMHVHTFWKLSLRIKHYAAVLFYHEFNNKQ